MTFLILDEISMLSQEYLFKIHDILQKIHSNNLPFGGVNIIAFGDFLQLKPVRATALFDNIVPSETLTRHNIWLNFDEVAILKKQCRAASDPFFQKLLSEARNRLLTDPSIALLNSRLLENNPAIDLLSPEWISAPIIVTRNEIADAINAFKHRTHCNTNSVTEYVISSYDTIGGLPLQEDLKKDLLQAETTSDPHGKLRLNDKIIPRVIHLSKGAKIMLLHNFKLDLNLVNGALGTVYDIIITEDSKAHLSNSAPNIRFLTKPPIILFKPDNPHPALANYSFQFLKTYPPGLIPILPRQHTLKYNYGLQTLTIQRFQLDISLGYAFTDYKVQGKTFSHAIVDLSPPSKGIIDPHSPYVMISRLKTSSGLLILRPFDISVFETPIEDDLKEEFKRQRTLDILSSKP
jgi:hypothetical protein